MEIFYLFMHYSKFALLMNISSYYNGKFVKNTRGNASIEDMIFLQRKVYISHLALYLEHLVKAIYNPACNKDKYENLLAEDKNKLDG